MNPPPFSTQTRMRKARSRVVKSARRILRALGPLAEIVVLLLSLACSASVAAQLAGYAARRHFAQVRRSLPDRPRN